MLVWRDAQLSVFDGTPIALERARNGFDRENLRPVLPRQLDVALEAGADMVGFVFFREARGTSLSRPARELSSRVKGRAEKVREPVDADDALLATIIDALKPDMPPASWP
jgi:hypothetical protein